MCGDITPPHASGVSAQQKLELESAAMDEILGKLSTFSSNSSDEIRSVALIKRAGLIKRNFVLHSPFPCLFHSYGASMTER